MSGGFDFATLAAAGLKRSLREALFLRTRLGLPRPTAIRATLTERCNYKCRYCYHWRQETDAPEMTVDEWKGIIDQLRDYAGRFPIQFIGGEPMIWPGFAELIQHCRARNVPWGAITNGSVLNARLVKVIVASRPSNIDISVDAGNIAVHDLARGVKGSFVHIEAGLMRLIEEREAAGIRFPIRIKTTVHKLNLAHLPELVGWVAELPGVTIDFSPVGLWQPRDRASLYPASDQEFEQLDAAVEELIRLKEDGAPIETSPRKLRSFGKHFRGETAIVHGYTQCRAGLRTLDIHPDGSASHCMIHSIGNLRSQSVQELWEQPSRRSVIEETLTCEHANAGCGVGCRAYRSGAQELRRALLFGKMGTRTRNSPRPVSRIDPAAENSVLKAG